jgi:hypothetical protein
MASACVWVWVLLPPCCLLGGRCARGGGGRRVIDEEGRCVRGVALKCAKGMSLLSRLTRTLENTRKTARHDM